jgi:hypothetical protein
LVVGTDDGFLKRARADEAFENCIAGCAHGYPAGLLCRWAILVERVGNLAC